MAFGDFRKKPNLVLLITDQESAKPYWPAGWAEANLPATSRLREHGLTFTDGYTNSCTCSPSRTTLFTGLYPSQHGVLEVLEFDNSGRVDPDPEAGAPTVAGAAGTASQLVKERRQRGLSSQLQNMAKILRTAGYHVVYKGKWHLSKPVQYSTSLGQKYWTDADRDHLTNLYGIHDWTMPDAGDNLKVANMGGGRVNNDGRFVDGSGQSAKYGYSIPQDVRERESVLHFLKNYDGDAPFCLIVSLVNPHDVLSYPGMGASAVTLNDGTQVPLYKAGGYHDGMFDKLPIEPPPTVNESLDTKPKAQAEFRTLANQGNGQINEDDTELQRGYCQFYAYLCQQADQHLGKVLDAIYARPGGKEDTVIFRISDHGDMAMAHGRQRQKMFNVYRETLNVPFIISNPVLFPKPETTGAFAGLIDILPTLATLGGVPDRDRWTFKGHDLSPILENPRAEVQDFVHFTYEDLYFYVPAPNHIRCLVEKRWKYAVYYDIYTGREPEYEMYDRVTDPSETRNLAHPGADVPEGIKDGIKAERQRLHGRLTQVMKDLGTTPDAIVWPKVSGGDAFVSTDLPDRKVDPDNLTE